MVRQVQSPRPAVRMAAPRARKSLAPAKSDTPAEDFDQAYFDKCLETQEGRASLFDAVDKIIDERDRYYVRLEQQDVDHAVLTARIDELEEDLQSSQEALKLAEEDARLATR